MKNTAYTLLSLLLTCSAAYAQAVWDWGNSRSDNRDKQWRGSIGAILSLDGKVDETFRAFYAATGQDHKQSLAESYDFDDFNIKCPYTTFGLHYDRQWKFFDYRWNLSLFKMSTTATAKRDYYMGVGDEIGYKGKNYDHLMIPDGSEFSLDFLGFMTDFTFGFTPMTFYYGEAEDACFTPSLDLGLVFFGGMYEIDAGEARGTTVYQNPPVDFVIGGKSRSFIGAGAPKIGLGGTLIYGKEDESQWITQASIGYFAYEGSTKLFTKSTDREKELDIKFLTLSAETGYRMPFDDGTAITFGAGIQFMSIDGEIRSKEKEIEKIVQARERFDKSAEMTMLTVNFFVGYSF